MILEIQGNQSHNTNTAAFSFQNQSTAMKQITLVFS